MSVKPGKKPRKYITKKSTEQRIQELQKELGLNRRWENLKLQMIMISR